jgi:Protein of unknown function (DUF2892)
VLIHEDITMLTTNVGSIDRILRVVIGAALIVWFFLDQSSGFWHYAKLLGIVPLVTGLIGNCPVYSMLGVSTCPMKKQ